MSDGKRVMKSDVVILSIKPQRPEFSPEKKHISVKVALQEWDKLDAYYRGQLYQLKHKQTKSPTETKKSGKSSSNSNHGGGEHHHKKSSSVTRRRSTSGHQLTELFGDENVPLTNHHENDSDDTNTRGSDEENKRPHERHRSSSRKHRDGKTKSDKINPTTPKPRKQLEEEEQNFLCVARDNFVIEFAVGEKKRTPIHQPEPPGLINPIKVEPYKPPIAIGFNVVHIQKILYHSGSGVQHTSPTTTTATTPEKPLNMDATSPNLTNNGDHHVTREARSKTPFTYGTGLEHGTSLQKETFRGNHNKGLTSNSNIGIIGKNKNSYKMTNADEGSSTQGNAITSTSLPMKRKSGHGSAPEIMNNNNNNATTTAWESNCPPNKKYVTDKDSRAMMPPPPPATEIRSSLPNPRPISSNVSITDKIIKKANELSPELKERERLRKLESLNRRAYAQQKTREHTVMDSVDVSMKALEMIWKQPLLSPIRSP